jgi:succinate dehydrogenase / fumarate reductase flavoprotein subunit
VFGKRAGNAISKYVKKIAWINLKDKNNLEAKNFIEHVFSSEGSEKVHQIRGEMQTIMTDYCSIYRNREGLETAYEKIQSLMSRFKKIKIRNNSKKHNYESKEAFELKNMLKLSEVIILSALKREESRGSHYRSDYPERDDSNWLKHTLASRTEKGIEIWYKPVSITRFQPEERKY